MGAYPRFYAAVVDMVVGEAKQTRMARNVARKAGLRSVPGSTTGGPATLIDVTLSADYAPLEWQFKANLSGFARLRLDARGANDLNLYYSLLGNASDDLDPGDYAPLGLAASDADGQVGESLSWTDLPEEARAPVRLCFVGEFLGAREDLGGPVGVFLQGE